MIFGGTVGAPAPPEPGGRPAGSWPADGVGVAVMSPDGSTGTTAVLLGQSGQCSVVSGQLGVVDVVVADGRHGDGDALGRALAAAALLPHGCDRVPLRADRAVVPVSDAPKSPVVSGSSFEGVAGPSGQASRSSAASSGPGIFSISGTWSSASLITSSWRNRSHM